MKKFAFILSMLLLATMFIEVSGELVLLQKRPDPVIADHGDGYQVPITADVTDKKLKVSFDEAIGVVDVKVANTSREVASSVVNTNMRMGATWELSTEGLEEGVYTLTIESGEDVYEGDFVVEQVEE